MSGSRKIVLLGHFGVGKTSLIQRFVNNSFSDRYKVTIGVHISKKTVRFDNGDELSLILWDLEGTDEVCLIRNAYLAGTHATVFVFDVGRPSTFSKLREDLGIVQKKIPNAPIIVVGNKCDLVAMAELKTMLHDQGIEYDYLTSAKTGETVDTLFNHLAKLLTSHA